MHQRAVISGIKMNSGKFILNIICFAASVGSVFGQSSSTPRIPPTKPSTRLSIQAAVDPPSAKIGTPVFLKLRLKNVSSGVVRLSDIDVERNFDLLVTDASGK